MDKQILEVVASVSMEKGVDKAIIFEALEEAIASATKKLVDDEANIEVVIDTTSGEYKTYRNWTIIVDKDDVEDEVFEVSEEAIAADKDGWHKVEDGIATKLIENIDFGRISAQAAKQVIIQKVREAERSKITQKYESLVGEVISGQVKRINRDFLLLEIEEDLNAQIPRDQIIPGEIFKLNDRVRAVIKEIVTTPRGPQIILSRTDERLVVQLFTQEVPEISEGTIEIKAIARDPGYRSKIAVKTYDGRIDPVGACVGMKGSRIHGIVRELGNENIDVINYTNNTQLFITRALSPAKINTLKIDEEEKRVQVFLDPEEVSRAIGKGGFNIRLAGKLTGYEIDVYREGAEEDVELKEFGDEIDDWVIEEFRKVGLDTAKSILELEAEDLVKRTDLEEETVVDVLKILKKEFED